MEKNSLPDQQEIIDSYNNIHSQTEKLLEMPSFYNWILDKLEITSKCKLLDIAMGSGTLIKCAQERGVDAYGIDISIKALEKAKELLPKKKITLSDGERLPFENSSFDFVTNIGSLEHFIYPDIGVKEIHRVMNDSGRAAIFLPNSYYLGDIIFSVMIKGDGPSHNQKIDRFATKNEWKYLLNSNGLTVKKIYRYNFLLPRNMHDFKYIIKRPKKILGGILSPLVPFNLSYSFLFICEKQ